MASKGSSEKKSASAKVPKPSKVGAELSRVVPTAAAPPQTEAAPSHDQSLSTLTASLIPTEVLAKLVQNLRPDLNPSQYLTQLMAESSQTVPRETLSDTPVVRTKRTGSERSAREPNSEIESEMIDVEQIGGTIGGEEEDVYSGATEVLSGRGTAEIEDEAAKGEEEVVQPILEKEAEIKQAEEVHTEEEMEMEMEMEIDVGHVEMEMGVRHIEIVVVVTDDEDEMKEAAEQGHAGLGIFP